MNDLDAQAKALAAQRGRDVGVRVIGRDRRVEKALGEADAQPSNVISPDEEQLFTAAGAIEPPYDPLRLIEEFENSNALRQNADAYAQNIDGFGHRFEPVFDMDSDDIDQQIADAIWTDMAIQAEREMVDFDPDFDPPFELVEETKRKIQRQMRRELIRAKCFFDFAVSDRSFVRLRKDTTQDREVVGWSFWEIRRDATGALAGFSYVPSFTVMAVEMKDDVIEREVPIRRSPLRFDRRREVHRAKRWVQITNNKRVYFKEFNDPRLISAKTGTPWSSGPPSPEDFAKMINVEGRDATPATELVQFKIHTPRSACYGVPRWIGNLKSVRGSRKAEYVNLLYFENKSIPPMAVLVSGGSLTEAASDRLEDFIANDIKGSDNFHKMLIIEAESASNASDPLNTGKVRVELIPLNKAIHNDALFMKYDETNREKIGQSMRVPKVIRGDTKDFNRATAQAAIEFAEEQVFKPEREDFDWFMNRFIMPELGIVFWRFRSNSPISTDLEAAKAIAELTKVGVLTPAEARRLTARVFNEDLKRLDAAWVNQPLQLTLAGVLMESPDGGNTIGGTGSGDRMLENTMSGSAAKMLSVIREARKKKQDPVEELSRLFKLRNEFLQIDRDEAIKEFESARENLKEDEAEIVRLKWDGPIEKYFVERKEEDDQDASDS